MSSDTGSTIDGDPAELDDATSARVRRELALLGSPAPAPDVPGDVTARIGAALRAAPRPDAAHSARPRRLSNAQRAGLGVGVGAAVLAVAVGAAALVDEPEPRFPRGPTASQITVDRPERTAFPLTDDELRSVLASPSDLGPFTDPARRADCLSGLGHPPGVDVVGGRRVEMAGTAAVVLLLPAPEPQRAVAVAVDQTCSAARPGLLAETVFDR